MKIIKKMLGALNNTTTTATTTTTTPTTTTTTTTTTPEGMHGADHGLRTPNEGINQRYLKNWANVADKISFGRT